jgi:molybdopterin-containing oxidoreductase family iron-sulfur binding subunit
MDRRTFLKIVGMGSISVAAGCTPDPYGGPRPDKHLFAPVHHPDNMVTGDASWYASTCRECPAGCGILAKNREGRIIKVEGNPDHPINRGALCMRGQSALQGIYNPDRLQMPQFKENGRWRPVSFVEAERILQNRIDRAVNTGENRIRMLTETVGEVFAKLLVESLSQWNSPAPLTFELFAYESLKTANGSVFGVQGLPSYRVDESDVLVGFGADFLETWLSPVEYARKFKAMHALQGDTKGKFFHVGPYQSLTGANADLWLACHPGGEAVVAMGLIREILQRQNAEGTPPSTLNDGIADIVAPYTRDEVAARAGVAPERYDALLQALLQAERPLILGSGAGSAANALPTDTAANLLNRLLDPELARIDFTRRHRVETADGRKQVLEFFEVLDREPVDLLLLNNVNPVYALPRGAALESVLNRSSLFVVSFSSCMDETARMADLVLPVRLPLENWDEYGGHSRLVSTLQPAMGRLTDAPFLGDVFLRALEGRTRGRDKYKSYLVSNLIAREAIDDEMGWLQTIRRGGIFAEPEPTATVLEPDLAAITEILSGAADPIRSGYSFVAAPSIRYFDGRGANRPWLSEVPEPVSRVAWQSTVFIHPQTLKAEALRQGDVIKVSTRWGDLQSPVYEAPGVKPGVLIMPIGLGHTDYGRYAAGRGAHAMNLLEARSSAETTLPNFVVDGVNLQKTGRRMKLAHTDGSRNDYGRKIALSIPFDRLGELSQKKKAGLAMWDFPLTLPLPEGYDPKRDFYPPHDHAGYRWSMAVDMDRCIGCGACAAACYAENNIGIVGEERIAEGREMAWLQVVRYENAANPEKITWLPLMCQHCDNAPCESVCPVYAPHHNKEGMNNQIYNRCIGTRFCAQNCPYKVRRFNWFTWQWPGPMQYQLNPNVTVRSKGVMEKCSFCIQRIKVAHGVAKNENRNIRDGEVVPACVQTCPTGALIFGNLMDKNSRIRTLVDSDLRVYQIMGYLNTKPAVFYLKKVTHNL